MSLEHASRGVYVEEMDYTDSDSWCELNEKDKSYSRVSDRRSRERSRSRGFPSSPERRKHRSPRSPRSRKQSRSRSRGRESSYSHRRSRVDDEYEDSSRSKYRRDVEPSNTIIVKGLPVKYHQSDIWTLVHEQGFRPRDVRILRRKDTGGAMLSSVDHFTFANPPGVSRGFGFIEFENVEDAAAWLKHTQGRLVLEQNRFADMEYSCNRSQHGSSLVGASNLQRGGDWICGKCSTINFKKRDFCFKCNVKRDDSDVICGDGFSNIGVVPSNTLLLRNLPYEVDETRLLDALKEVCSVDVRQTHIAKNGETGLSRGFGYIQMNTVAEAAQILTNLTAITKLIIDGREVLISYSNVPLEIVMAKTALSHNLDVSNQWGGSAQIPYAACNLSVNQQADAANAAAAVAQNAIKKARVMRQVAVSGEESYAFPNQSIAAAVQEAASAYQMDANLAFATGVQSVSSNDAQAKVDLGTVSTPHGEFPRFNAPDVSTFQFDQSSGYYYDSATGLYYDAKSTYYYNPYTRAYVYWDASYQTYLPVPVQQESKAEEVVTVPAQQEQQPSEPAKPKSKSALGQDKVKMAKKIQKDMEKWAKQLNQRKEVASRSSNKKTEEKVLKHKPASGESPPTPSSTADTAFAIFDRSGVALETDDTSPVEAVEEIIDDQDLEEQLIDWDGLTCLLCRRQFKNKDVLIKHQQLSDLHKKNLQCKRMEVVSAAVTSSRANCATGRYRDRAKERRDKFGVDDQPQPSKLKEKYLVESASEGITAASDATVGPSMTTSSRGAKLMRNMGWQEGQGLGRKNQGIVDPILAERRVAGVGLGAAGSVNTSAPGGSYKDHVKAALRQKFESL